MKERILTITYDEEFDVKQLRAAIMTLLFVPYHKGKRYEQSQEITAKIPILQLLFGPYFNDVFQSYLDQVNSDISGFANLVEDILEKLQESDGKKFEISFDVKKVG